MIRASRSLCVIGALLTLSSLAPGNARAQPPGPDFTFVLTPSAIVFPQPGLPEFQTGWVDYSSLTINVRPRPGGGRPQWEVYIRAADPDLGGYGKPLADLMWRLDGTTAWTPLTGADQLVMAGNGRKDVVLHFRILLNLALDTPGTYGTPLVITAVRR